MIKNKKAQVMTLDVLFSVVLIMLMFFLLFNIAEAKINQTNNDIVNKELNNIGTLAVMKITNSPNLSCYAKDNRDNYYLIPSCISENTYFTKENLGIPSNYKCSLTSEGRGNPFTNNPCTDTIGLNHPSYFSMNFKVSIVNNLKVSKSNYISYYLDSDDFFTETELNLKVWK